jgi:hypothetical protein
MVLVDVIVLRCGPEARLRDCFGVRSLRVGMVRLVLVHIRDESRHAAEASAPRPPGCISMLCF